VELLRLYIALDKDTIQSAQQRDRVTRGRVSEQLPLSSRDFSVSTYVSPQRANQQFFQNFIDISTVSYARPCNSKIPSSWKQQSPTIAMTSPCLVNRHRVKLSDSTMESHSHPQSAPKIVQMMYNALQRMDSQEFGCLYSKAGGTASSKHEKKATPAQLSVILVRLRDELPSFFDHPHSIDLYTKQLIVENGLFGPIITTR
jgi:hypothetical protein